MTEERSRHTAGLTRRQTLRLAATTGAGLMLPRLLGRDCAEAATAKTPKGQMIIGFSQEPTVFNPHLLHIEVDEGVHYAIFDPLFTIDPAGKFQPALAVEVPTVANGGISADGLHWKVKLRDGVTWHDGKPFTADDVKFTLELMVDPKFLSWRRTGHELVRDLTVVSPTELTWRMESPFAPYASILATTFILPKHAFDGVADKNTAPFNNAPIGTGAFKWGSRVAGDHLEVVANRDYFGEGPFLERAIYKYIPDLTVLYTQFKSGDIDMTGLAWITPDNYAEAKTLPGKVVSVDPASTVECFTLNTDRPQFKDPAVRQALYYAFDKDSILQALYYGLPVPTESYVPQQSFYYNPNLPKHEFSIAKAKEVLDKAGWVPGADGIWAKNGVRLSFANSTTTGNHLREQVQQFLQQTFKDAGIEMKISNMPAAVLFGEFWMQSKFDSVIHGQDFLTAGDPDTSDYFKSTGIAAKGGSGMNFWEYTNPEVDALLKKGAALFVPDERKAVYDQLQEIVRADLPFLPIFQYVEVRGRKKGLEGPAPNVNVRIDTWNVNTWRWA